MVMMPTLSGRKFHGLDGSVARKYIVSMFYHVGTMTMREKGFLKPNYYLCFSSILWSGEDDFGACSG
jgi:hypothetical protein